jgi:hypothetical protein
MFVGKKKCWCRICGLSIITSNLIPKSQRDFCAKEKVKIKKILLRATKLLVKGRKKKKGGKMSFFVFYKGCMMLKYTLTLQIYESSERFDFT